MFLFSISTPGVSAPAHQRSCAHARHHARGLHIPAGLATLFSSTSLSFPAPRDARLPAWRGGAVRAAEAAAEAAREAAGRPAGRSRHGGRAPHAHDLAGPQRGRRLPIPAGGEEGEQRTSVFPASLTIRHVRPSLVGPRVTLPLARPSPPQAAPQGPSSAGLAPPRARPAAACSALGHPRRQLPDFGPRRGTPSSRGTLGPHLPARPPGRVGARPRVDPLPLGGCA